MKEIRNSNKIKPILPSLRERKRYVVFNIISNKKTEYKPVFNEIISSFKKLFGEVLLGKAGLMALDGTWNKEKQSGAFRVNRKYLDQARAAMTLVKQINDNKIIIRSVGVSGILKKAKQKWL